MWVLLLPPAGFAWVAFGRLAADYPQSLQSLGEAAPAPVRDPGLRHGAMRAVQCVLVVPFLLALAVMILLTRAHPEQWWLLLPGLISLPVYSMIPASDGEAVPLSRPVRRPGAA